MYHTWWNQSSRTRLLLSVITISALLLPCSADEFTSPSNSKTDLSTQYTLGQTVQLAWQTSLEEITLIVSHWGGDDVGVLLCKCLELKAESLLVIRT